MTRIITKLAVTAVFSAGIGLAGPALAAENAMKVCGAKYQAAKTAKTLPAGQTWNQFLAQCRGGMAKPAVATAPTKPAAPAAAAKPARVTTAAKSATTPGQPSAAQTAMYARERQCGAQYKAAKAGGKLPAGQTWPQYWSACNKRMK